MKRLSLISILCTVLALSSCSGEAGGSGRIVVASLRGPSSVAMVQMIDSIADTAGASVEIRLFDEPLQLRKMMLDGSADFAVLPSTMAALMYNRGMDYRLAAVPLWGTLYLCGSRQISDLKGERVYLMAKGMTPDVIFRHLLSKKGLNPETDLTLDYRFPSHIDLAGAAIAGRAPLCVLPEPYLSLAVKRNPGLCIISDLNEEWSAYENTPLPETAFIVRGALAETSPEVVRKMVEAYARSGEWVKSNPREAAGLVVEYGILPDYDAALASIPRSHIGIIPTADARNAVESYFAIIFKTDPRIIGDSMPDEKFYFE